MPIRICGYKMKIDRKYVDYESVDKIHLAQDRLHLY
jgi:hypothetical protein